MFYVYGDRDGLQDFDIPADLKDDRGRPIGGGLTCVLKPISPGEQKEAEKAAFFKIAEIRRAQGQTDDTPKDKDDEGDPGPPAVKTDDEGEEKFERPGDQFGFADTNTLLLRGINQWNFKDSKSSDKVCKVTVKAIDNLPTELVMWFKDRLAELTFPGDEKNAS